ncbi:aminoglycoside phosphotransferase family protein [Streptomyces cyaneochromogenes]|uniref:Aminoglycoside phosphotransferase family protein n=1 Tax=Streptomyces cyaneochromogenes TaxID=2496836 RepID=A0A3S9M2S0_9ACTN|nr:phosphotransferase [Streptomyces cyaneochromogenes]AZQ33498.1 aminoglycoside phosphotransferase family protein [Streptomyces cyaneochromogenes]
MTPNPLLPALTAQAEAAAHSRTTTCPCGAPVTLADRPDATVVRHADTVAKAHAPDLTPTDLTPRLTTAAHLPDLLLPPLTPTPVDLHGRLVTFWPYGTPVDPADPDAAPWEAAATLLARLHRAPAPAALPPMRGPAKAARAISRLRAVTAAERTAPERPAATERTTTTERPAATDRTTATERPAATEPTTATPSVLRAWDTLPAWSRAEAPQPDSTTLCHGDLHLGQLVRHPAPDGPWLLIDVDDLGVGVPAWDLARPAAWYACGLLSPEEWTRFLTAYRAAGGTAVPAEGDPWPALDVPARALTVQTAARAITKALAEGRFLDEVEQSLVDACDRMASVPPELTHGHAK